MANAHKHDMTFVKDIVQKLSGITNEQLNMSYYMYFDETNNVKCVRANKNTETQRTLNIDNIQEHFILGGIATKEKEEPLTFDEFKKIVGLSEKSPQQEIKSSSIYHGDFVHVLRSKTLTPILELIYGKHWLIHFSDVNLLYYSIVDIIDSIVWNSSYKNLWLNPYVFYGLKDELYRIFASNLDSNINRLMKFNYPDVKKEDLHAFREFLAEMILQYSLTGGKMNQNTALLVEVIIDSDKNQRDLVFVQDEEKGILIEDFVQFYTTRLSVLSKSHLILDNEGDIIEALQNSPLFMDGDKLKNYQFVDSKSNTFIQLSDIIVGLLSRYFLFVDKTWMDIKDELDQLPDISMKNLKLLNKILLYSEKENTLLCNQIERIGVINNFWQTVNNYQ